MHKVDRDRVRMVRGLFAETVAQSRETPHRHSHSEVLSLDITRRDTPGIGGASV
jgi:hypothetical protein